MKFPAELLKQCWFLTGPTAVGKTSATLRIAKDFNAEILSLDSMAVYRRMDIGTAKPTQSERQSVLHHLIDLADPHHEFSVAEYLRAAVSAVEDVLSRGRIPLFAGGTGLYLRAILRGLFDGPPANWSLRHRMEQLAQQHGPEYLYHQLITVDPPTAARLHVNDQRRIIRALEVYEVTGVRLSAQQKNAVLPVSQQPAAVFWLEPNREWLCDRIDRRVEEMMQRGLLEETRRLLNICPAPGRTARQALGYRELIAHLEDGLPLQECVDLIRVRTRQFAKRQHTWFRNMEECCSISVRPDESECQLVDRILNEFRACEDISGQ
ncbi:MAG: tRNA (adenosine(37)-N6)-dimethylallyltransferase MiaA [Fuerstiella sp.]|nr:tRNA (adenosine(37)-N6)-dimethylallyltransferase MiaA [Fuerstiella sp.]